MSAEHSNSTLTASFSSFSGANIRATFGGQEVGELRAISYAIQREKAPEFVMGWKSARGFSRGKRGISGTLVWAVFTNFPLLNKLGPDRNYQPWLPPNEAKVGQVLSTFGSQASTNDQYASYDGARQLEEGDWEGVSEKAQPSYLDQILPFNITILAANEYGKMARQDILGVEIINYGSGMSVDDISQDQSMTFIALDITPFREASHSW